jgi:DNA-binding NarL/FixJ family response regulator
LFDKQILFHLSKGTKSKDITQYIPISINAIEVRKSNLKELLEVIDGTDLDLVREARNRAVVLG